MTIRIANAAGFWGDDLDAARRILVHEKIDYLTLEYLAELTMSILSHQKSKDPDAGFATDVLTVLGSIVPQLKLSDVRVITNAGGVNPVACAREFSKILVDANLDASPVAVVSGDDLLPKLSDFQRQGIEFRNLDTGQTLSESGVKPVSAHAYLGARGIVDALDQGARFVITGRVADASLTLGPAVHKYRWRWDDWNRLADASVAGHLIECGAQVTGGYSDRRPEIDLVEIGYPIAELEPDGSSTITKPIHSGGVVDRRSVVEQLVYEIGDPSAYITPDVVVDFTTVVVEEAGVNRVRVLGATGKPATDHFKVSLAYEAGFMSSAMLLVRGQDAVRKARTTGELVLQRLQRRGIQFARTNIETLGGTAECADGTANETVLRISVHDSNRRAVELFGREIAPLITNGPSGLAGYAAGRPTVRPVLAYWPTLVPKAAIQPVMEIRSAKDWSNFS